MSDKPMLEKETCIGCNNKYDKGGYKVHLMENNYKCRYSTYFHEYLKTYINPGNDLFDEAGAIVTIIINSRLKEYDERKMLCEARINGFITTSRVNELHKKIEKERKERKEANKKKNE